MTESTITRRKLLKNAGIMGASVLAGASLSECSKSGSSAPNILFLLTDDQRWDTLGCMGSELLKTPNIDRLAANGVVFDNAFVTTSICPSNRACILSGQHLRTNGIRGFQDAFSPEAFQQTYPALMKKAGYRTGFIGKYGVGATMEKLQYPSSQFDYWRGMEGQGPYFQEIDGQRKHSTQILADQAVDFLNHSSKEQPWCLSISFKAPHQPWNEYDPDLSELFKGKKMPLAASAFEEAENFLPEFIRDSLSGSQWWHMADKDLQEWIRNYYRLVIGIDIAVGKILSALKDNGFDDNTVIILTSDNGYLLYEHGLMGKWLMYEESIRIPMIFYDPRLPKNLRGQRRDDMVLSIDCAPSLLAMAGVQIPSAMQGRDLTPLLWGRQVSWREDWFYEHTYTEEYPRYIPKSQGVRTERWKYIRYIDQEPEFEQLFDLENDRLEQTNLAQDPEFFEILNNLRERFQYWRDILPSVNPDQHE